MKKARILLTTVMLFVAANVSAQFTITDTTKTELLPPLSILDEVKTNTTYHNDYYNEAAMKAARQARRKERNTLTFTVGMGLTQTGYENKNGSNTFAINTSLDFQHVYKVDKLSNTTRFRGNYGFNYIDKERFKNVDNFQFDLIPTWNIHKYWAFSMTTTLKSQFDKGYKNRQDTIKQSNFMAPGTLTINGGIQFKKGPWEINMSPIGGNAKFVLDRELSEKGLHGVEKGKRQKWDIGPSARVIYKNEFCESLWGQKFAPKLIFFKTELYSFTDIEFNSDAIFSGYGELSLRPVKWLSATVKAWCDFDRKVKTEKPGSPQWQYIYSIDLRYTFKNK